MPRKQAGRKPQPGARFLADVLAENVRAERARKRLSQGELAEQMAAVGHPWTQTTVSDVERGERNVTVDELVGLALVFLTNPQSLMSPQDDLAPIDLGPDTAPAPYVQAWLEGYGFMLLERDADGRLTLRGMKSDVEHADEPIEHLLKTPEEMRSDERREEEP